MDSHFVAYGLLACIFVFTTLRMFVGKPSRLDNRPVRLFERFRKTAKSKSSSIDS